MSGKHARRRPLWFYAAMGVVSSGAVAMAVVSLPQEQAPDESGTSALPRQHVTLSSTDPLPAAVASSSPPAGEKTASTVPGPAASWPAVQAKESPSTSASGTPAQPSGTVKTSPGTVRTSRETRAVSPPAAPETSSPVPSAVDTTVVLQPSLPSASVSPSPSLTPVPCGFLCGLLGHLVPCPSGPS